MVSPIWLSLPLIEEVPKRKVIVERLQRAINTVWSDAVKEFTEKGLATLFIGGNLHTFIDTGMSGANIIAPVKLSKSPSDANEYLADLRVRIKRSRAKPLLLTAGNRFPNGFRSIRLGLAEGRKATSIQFFNRTTFMLDFQFDVAVWQLENIIQPEIDVVGAASDGFWDFFNKNMIPVVNRELDRVFNVKVKEVKFRG